MLEYTNEIYYKIVEKLKRIRATELTAGIQGPQDTSPEPLHCIACPAQKKHSKTRSGNVNIQRTIHTNDNTTTTRVKRNPILNPQIENWSFLWEEVE
jgi:hypothetical protein